MKELMARSECYIKCEEDDKENRPRDAKDRDIGGTDTPCQCQNNYS